MIRVAPPKVPESAAREALTNALLHRDYTAAGAVRIVITEDAFTVTSPPGGFPPGCSTGIPEMGVAGRVSHDHNTNGHPIPLWMGADLHFGASRGQ